MLKSLLVCVMTLGAFSANAQSGSMTKDGSQELRLALAGKGLATDYGLEYEHRKGNLGMMGFFNFTKKREAQNAITGHTEQWVLGAAAPIHLQDGTDFDVYIAPGLAAIFNKEVLPDNKDVYTFGPVLKIGTLYSINSSFTAGLEFMYVSNWFSDKTASFENTASALVGYKF